MPDTTVVGTMQDAHHTNTATIGQTLHRIADVFDESPTPIPNTWLQIKLQVTEHYDKATDADRQHAVELLNGFFTDSMPTWSRSSADNKGIYSGADIHTLGASYHVYGRTKAPTWMIEQARTDAIAEQAERDGKAANPDLLDREGDRWTWRAGAYHYGDDTYGFSADDLERALGPCRPVVAEATDVTVTVTPAEVAQALADSAAHTEHVATSVPLDEFYGMLRKTGTDQMSSTPIVDDFADEDNGDRYATLPAVIAWFQHRWTALTDRQKHALAHRCITAGVEADWNAIYVDVLSDPSLKTREQIEADAIAGGVDIAGPNVDEQTTEIPFPAGVTA